MVLGCHPADCHYIGGNYRARRRVALIRLVLEQYGFDPKRLLLQWVSASEGEKFQKTVTDFVEVIRALGPTPIKSEKEKDMYNNTSAHAEAKKIEEE